MTVVRSLFTAKKILGGSLAKRSKVPKGFLAVYVSENKNEKQRYFVSVSSLNQPSFQAFLSESEEEFGFHHPIGGLTIHCPEDTFISITSSWVYG